MSQNSENAVQGAVDDIVNGSPAEDISQSSAAPNQPEVASEPDSNESSVASNPIPVVDISDVPTDIGDRLKRISEVGPRNIMIATEKLLQTTHAVLQGRRNRVIDVTMQCNIDLIISGYSRIKSTIDDLNPFEFLAAAPALCSAYHLFVDRMETKYELFINTVKSCEGGPEYLRARELALQYFEVAADNEEA